MNRPIGHGNRGPRKTAEVEIMRRDALLLYVEGHLSFSAIAAQMGISKTRAHELVQEGLAEVSTERRALATEGVERELLLIDAEIRTAMEIAAKPCAVCDGNAVTDVQQCENCQGVGKLGRPPDVQDCDECNGKGVTGRYCMVCQMTGNFYSPDLRLKAIDRIGRSAERRIKLLGLNAPTKAQIELPTDRSFYAELLEIPPEEFEREVAAFFPGISGRVAGDDSNDPDGAD